MFMRLLMGLLLAAVAAYLAYRLRSLSRSGAYAATLLGTVVFGLGGWTWAILLLAFFALSSALTHAFGRSKKGLEEKYSKGGRRDAGQVFSNGGVAGLFVILHAMLPDAVWPWIGFVGALAAVNADTWATELGVLNPSLPRLITSLGKRVEKGTSGGVSLVGTSASLLAAAVIGGLGMALLPGAGWPILLDVSMAGLAGSLADSLLGATVQAIYLCPLDQKETEKHPLHTCGTPTVHIRGRAWLNNDLVNLACSVVGAVIALGLAAVTGI